MRRLRDEDGAIAILVALLICFLMVPLAAVAVDLGMQRVARRDMQSMADVVALDLSRSVDGSRSTAEVLADWGCPGNASGTCAASSANRVGRSVDRNTSTMGDVPTVSAQLGCVDDSTGAFTPVDGACVKPDAVRVDSQTAVDFHLASGSGGASRSAIGMSKQSTCFYLGSFAARFSTNDSTLLQQNGGALNDLLGVNLDIVSYQGLAAADLSLADLAATSQIGGVDQLLGGGITLGDLISATYEVLNAQGEPENSVALNVLNNPTSWIGTDLNAVVDLGDLFGISTTDNAALQSDFNVLDMLAGAIAVADGDNFIALDQLGLLGVTDPALSYVKVIQGKQRACGKVDDPDPNAGKAKASQIDVHLQGTLENLGLGSLGIGVTAASGGYELNAKLGASEGRLVGDDGIAFPSVHCASGTEVDPDKVNVQVTNGLASADVKAVVTVKGSSSTPGNVVNVPLVSNLLNSLLGGLLGQVLKIDYDLRVELAAATATPPPTGIAHLQIPQNSLMNEKAAPPLPDGVPVSLGSANALQLPTLPLTPTVTGTVTVTSSLVSLLGLPIGTDVRPITFDAAMVQPLLNAVTTAVNSNPGLDTVTDGVNDVLAELGKVLGLSLGGVDVFGEYRPTCNGADLIG